MFARLVFLLLLAPMAHAENFSPRLIQCQARDSVRGVGHFAMETSVHHIRIVFAGSAQPLFDETHFCGYSAPPQNVTCQFNPVQGVGVYQEHLNCSYRDEDGEYPISFGAVQFNRATASGALDCRSLGRANYHIDLTRCEFLE